MDIKRKGRKVAAVEFRDLRPGAPFRHSNEFYLKTASFRPRNSFSGEDRWMYYGTNVATGEVVAFGASVKVWPVTATFVVEEE